MQQGLTVCAQIPLIAPAARTRPTLVSRLRRAEVAGQALDWKSSPRTCQGCEATVCSKHSVQVEVRKNPGQDEEKKGPSQCGVQLLVVVCATVSSAGSVRRAVCLKSLLINHPPLTLALLSCQGESPVLPCPSGGTRVADVSLSVLAKLSIYCTPVLYY